MIAGFVIGLLLLIGASELARRALERFYDAYVAVFGGYPTRRDLAEKDKANPLARSRILFRRDAFRIGQLYVSVADMEVERLRRRAALATNLTFLVFTLQFPLWELAGLLTSSSRIPSNWLILRISSTIALLVAGSALMQFLIASESRGGSFFWRVLCVFGIIGGVIGFFVIRSL